MKELYCSEWVTVSSGTNGLVKKKAYDEKMVILDIEGECVVECNGIAKPCAISLLQTEGELSLMLGEKSTMILAPAYMDFFCNPTCHDIKTTRDFKGLLIMTEQLFFQQTVDDIRFNLSEVIYRYVKSPFVTLTEEETRRMFQLVEILESTINRRGHHFRYKTMKALLQALNFDLWNIILRIFGKEGGNTEYVWANMVEDFLHLVRTYCRRHHEVRWFACQLGVSSDALSAKLRKFYGKSARRLIDEELAADAKTCLLEPKNTIQKVAEMLCFSDQASFNKFFKRCCGMSPTAFKKSRTL